MDEGAVIYEALEPSADQARVLEALEAMQQSFDEVNIRLEQLHADASLVFLAVALLIGVVIGCAIGFMFSRIWQV